jgi:hypothetical protein
MDMEVGQELVELVERNEKLIKGSRRTEPNKKLVAIRSKWI